MHTVLSVLTMPLSRRFLSVLMLFALILVLNIPYLKMFFDILMQSFSSGGISDEWGLMTNLYYSQNKLWVVVAYVLQWLAGFMTSVYSIMSLRRFLNKRREGASSLKAREIFPGLFSKSDWKDFVQTYCSFVLFSVLMFWGIVVLLIISFFPVVWIYEGLGVLTRFSFEICVICQVVFVLSLVVFSILYLLSSSYIYITKNDMLAFFRMRQNMQVIRKSAVRLLSGFFFIVLGVLLIGVLLGLLFFGVSLMVTPDRLLWIYGGAFVVFCLFVLPYMYLFTITAFGELYAWVDPLMSCQKCRYPQETEQNFESKDVQKNMEDEYKITEQRQTISEKPLKEKPLLRKSSKKSSSQNRKKTVSDGRKRKKTQKNIS